MTTPAPPALESLKAGEGSPDQTPPDESSGNEWAAWAMRKRLPSELAQKTALRWPHDVSYVLGIPEQTLKALRAEGDHPRMYGLGRAMFTTNADLQEWVLAHELAPGQKLRPATILKGTKRPVKKVAGQVGAL
jgi:hypothetical protein